MAEILVDHYIGSVEVMSEQPLADGGLIVEFWLHVLCGNLVRAIVQFGPNEVEDKANIGYFKVGEHIAFIQEGGEVVLRRIDRE